MTLLKSPRQSPLPMLRDPFEGATLTGTLTTEDGSRHWDVEGFCDAENGSIFRIRFMAPQAGALQILRDLPARRI